MDHETIRRRGWSIHSEATHPESATDENCSLNPEEKHALLNSFPSMEEDKLMQGDHPFKKTEEYSDNASTGEVVDEEDGEEKALPSSHLDRAPPRKRRKLEDGAQDVLHVDKSLAPTRQPGTGTIQLSKWAARLFDPDRPRGVIEPPKTIPMNDVFLTEFGKREKEFDSLIGRKLEVDQVIADYDDNDENEGDPMSVRETSNKTTKGYKVKVTNLAFTTTSATLEQACAQFGELKAVNLLMDKENDEKMNLGRAYVTFEKEESAIACMEKLTKLDGRSLRISVAAEDPKQGRKPTSSALTRYWERDISTKCFRCGQVGHTESECLNEAIPKPCPLCAKCGHDMRNCPFRQFCFNCGIPGHVTRDCPQQRGQSKRMVCGICFQTGHHRVGCWRLASEAPAYDAICMVCNRWGHFTCKDMKWFFGLDGESCFNCGLQGHTGYNCERPGLDACSRDESLADREIETAETNSLVEEFERQKNRGRERVSPTSNSSRDRSRSQPPRHDGRNSEQYNDHGRRFSSSQPPRSRQESRGSQGPRRGYDCR